MKVITYIEFLKFNSYLENIDNVKYILSNRGFKINDVDKVKHLK